MKTHIQNPLLFPMLITGVGLMLVGPVTAQTFTTLYSFNFTNSDGANPQAGLVQGSDGNFYGTTTGSAYNGSLYDTVGSPYGTVFKISTSGVLTSLYSFTGSNDGGFPGELVQGSDGNFYGTTSAYANNGGGNVFKISPNGLLTHLDLFPGNDPPFATLLVQKDGSVYGTTQGGGTNNTLFKLSTNGVVTTLFSFSFNDLGGGYFVQGSDGNFYGTTFGEPPFFSRGTVVKLSTNGLLTTLYSFTGGNDGANPIGLVQGRDGIFYGSTAYGGTAGEGTVFKINANGVLTSLYSFGSVTNDGRNPCSLLVQGSDGNFYGTTFGEPLYGGTNGNGTVFKFSADGALTTLYSFTGGNDGANPQAGLVQGSDGNFYGTTVNGGAGGAGTVFRLTVPLGPPQLTIMSAGTNVILTWPTNFIGYTTLQSTTDLGSPVWTTNSPAPVLVNGQNTVTNPISGTQQFFRLSQ